MMTSKSGNQPFVCGVYSLVKVITGNKIKFYNFFLFLSDFLIKYLRVGQ